MICDTDIFILYGEMFDLIIKNHNMEKETFIEIVNQCFEAKDKVKSISF